MLDKKWYLGLDMGTSSVGWAATDENYKLLRLKGKDAWGIREFEEAQVAVERRTHRTNRRRRQREMFRIGMLKELFQDAIMKVDSNFYVRLDNSKYYLEDKDECVRSKNGVFNDSNYTDKEYFEQYPTIFHLRSELIHNTQKHDVRLVFLAILHMFKHRGHFLNASLSSGDNSRGISEIYNDFLMTCEEVTGEVFKKDIDAKLINEILGNLKYSKSKKTEELIKELGIDKSNKIQQEILKVICGRKVDIRKIFIDIELEEDKKVDICFSDFGYEEKCQDILDSIGEENYHLVELMKEIYDNGLLAGIMQDASYLSDARIRTYDKHKQDLSVLKELIKEYGTLEEYNDMFRNESQGSYSAYVNSFNSNNKQRRDFKGRKREEFYDTVKKLISKYQKGKESDERLENVLDEITNESFMPKQMSASNGVIPMQAHLKELKKILKNAEVYLSFLSEKDETNLTTSEKIIELFSFQIPYYIGPTSLDSVGKGKNGWVIRRKGEEKSKVLPWTFDKVIDKKATSEKFIERMVRRCTYIEGESVLPKASLMYERFKVLNEINNICINDKRLPVELKQELYSCLYENGNKVTRKKIFDFLYVRGCVKEQTDVTGIDITVNNQLSSYGKFKAIFGEKIREDRYKEMAESVIYWCTIYGDSKDFLKERLKEEYPEILADDKVLKRILGFKFKDWGNLSKKFLELDGIDKSTGEEMSIIRAMWESQYNLMELINSDDYTFGDNLKELEKRSFGSLSEMKAEDLDELYFSAPVKRMVWQTIQIIKELEGIVGCSPNKVFIEMTRGGENEKRRTTSRKQQMLDLYKNIKDDSKNWKSLIEDADNSGKLKSKKMYLYLTQMGRCMYTGESIDLDNLFKDNLYDIDHIYPRHFVKDDNLNNNLVLVKKEINARKSDDVLSLDIQSKMQSQWKFLREKQLINDEKYRRLCRKDAFSEEEKAGFIARQLVETSQGTKAVADLLKKIMPSSKVVYSKASLVSDFRHNYDLLKCRSINEFHHANDAYLNIVVGNVYDTKFTQNPLNFIRKEYSMDKEKYNYNMDKMFKWNVERNGNVAWIADDKGNGTIATVKAMMAKNTPLMTRYSFERHGQFFDENPISKKYANEKNYVSLKVSDDKNSVLKYGGYTSLKPSYFIFVEYGLGKKRKRAFDVVYTMYAQKIKNLKDLQDYCENVLNLDNVKILCSKIKMDSLLKIDGYFAYIAGMDSRKNVEWHNAVNMCINSSFYAYIKKVENYISKKVLTKDISKEENLRIYDLLCEKHNSGIFARKLKAEGIMLKNGRDQFIRLNSMEQCDTLMKIISLSKVGVSNVNLKEIGGSSEAGRLRLSGNMTDKKELKIINQSVTGLYVNEIDLLHV